MRVLLAPDGFGGTLSAVQAAQALARGWASAAPRDELVLLPLSDGGPGLLEVLAAALPDAQQVPVVVPGPFGVPVPAALLVVEGPDGRTVWVESASACGLHLLDPAERDPWRTGTAGVGELLRAALDLGPRRIRVGLGGSGTHDGGAGALGVLGLVALDVDGAPVPPGAHGLRRVASLQGPPDPRLADVTLEILTDVGVPLSGAGLFAAQKGAPVEDLPALAAALQRWGDLLLGAGLDVQGRPGAGAAGGLGAGLLALGAARVAGLQAVAQTVGLAEHLAAADLVVTGEGTLDATSLLGKVCGEVAGRAAEAAVPCLVLAGQVQLGRREAAARGIDAAYATTDLVGLEASLADPAGSLQALAARTARQWSG